LLLEKLQSFSAEEPISGAMLGESAESVKKYLDTLTFSTVAHGGYNRDEVHMAMAHVKRYIDFLDERIKSLEIDNDRNAAEIERLRQTEETLVENLLKARSEADVVRKAGMSSIASENGESLLPDRAPTPIEILFRKKAT
jgi:LPS O-antigen subunit length determinant protein (WzzB/FepE family)